MALSKKKSSALSEKDGVAMPSTINPKIAMQVQSLRKKTISIDQLSQQLMAGNITALSQGITLIESTQTKHQEMAADLIARCLP
jgi:LAO/AO transport system kinase